MTTGNEESKKLPEVKEAPQEAKAEVTKPEVKSGKRIFVYDGREFTYYKLFFHDFPQILILLLTTLIILLIIALSTIISPLSNNPDTKMTTDEVRLYYATFFPELANAEVLAAVARPSKELPGLTEQVTEFKRRTGTKGARCKYNPIPPGEESQECIGCEGNKSKNICRSLGEA